MMRSTGANRKETVEGIASFTKATKEVSLTIVWSG